MTAHTPRARAERGTMGTEAKELDAPGASKKKRTKAMASFRLRREVIDFLRMKSACEKNLSQSKIIENALVEKYGQEIK
jgi:hypothetical protein